MSSDVTLTHNDVLERLSYVTLALDTITCAKSVKIW